METTTNNELNQEKINQSISEYQKIYEGFVGKLEKCGNIAKQAKEYSASIAKPGASMLQVAEKTEDFIREKGGLPAFPVNLSLNDSAAHHTPSADDKQVIPESGLLKVDVGVHLEGWITDTAITIDLDGSNSKITETAKLALDNALSEMKAGVSSRQIGKVIESTIKSKGFKPIENLCGHSLERWILHAGLEIPNIEMGGHILQEGEIFAVEPFVSNGSGMVHEIAGEVEIYSVASNKQVRLSESRRLLSLVLEEYRLLPFAKRWLQEIPSLNLAINDLSRQGVLHGYPVLKETTGSIVAQAETTIVVEKDSVKVLV